ncbi:ABC transporter permease [Porphyromonas sp. oral taxon 275]|uniref:ABC transporter permease n=1 Tax=Porphyromonas sp. oral taxon 275 TaxID=712435 RepID=UPI001BAB80B1|nr:ABC transporter permease [Porphyromonas sp. oral taxon 275]QUB42533.1 ABC transporter permease [Porphyromonas sp. oral taxon 275]
MAERLSSILEVMRREWGILRTRPIYFFGMILAPFLTAFLLLYMMAGGLPQDMPVAVVDEDGSATSRALVRSLDAFQSSRVSLRALSMQEALSAMRRGEVYAIYHIPRGLQAHAGSARQPKIHYYTNGSYLMAGSFTFRDMKMLSELASAKVGLQTGQARGRTEEQIMGAIQPIRVQLEVMSNPWLNYSAYLTTTILPGVLQLMIFLITSYSIGVEIKRRTARSWLAAADGSMVRALVGKLLPHTLIFLLVGWSLQGLLYGWMGYPLQSSWWSMAGAMLALVLSAQSLGAFFVALIPVLRMSLSLGSLLGMLSFSISGMSIPVSTMSPAVQALSHIFPLRYYYQIGINQALVGAPWVEAMPLYLGLLAFLLLPLVTLPRLRHFLLHMDYIA